MIDRLQKGLLSFAGIVVLAIMGVTVVDVIGRYVLNRPLAGSFEITQLLLVLVIFAGLPAVCAAGSHIRVDVLLHMMSKGVRRFVERASAAMIVATLVYLAILTWEKAGEVVAIGDVTPFLHIPIGPFAYFISASCGLAAIAFTARMLRELRRVAVPADRSPS
ncbi:TRAP transporter small permease [Microbaculum marinisediminis]|uniref:TRAP transporter small permease protein n=1 Tax=Microbaculum marinisediminis TaxID=2931392 RepID=A0AAW5R0J3_9HYPH|nr:TRAP transporter small permease [Microbaculum sp. A6E488]MCT8973488.1 TRAP transporter small permease [Microbaculum sp. A6E488]